MVYILLNLVGFGVKYQPPYTEQKYFPFYGGSQIDELGRLTIMVSWYGDWNLEKPPNSLQPKGTVSNYHCLGRRWRGKIHRAIFPCNILPGRSLLSLQCFRITFSYFTFSLTVYSKYQFNVSHLSSRFLEYRFTTI